MNKKDGLLINSSHKRNSTYIHQDWHWNYKLGREPWKSIGKWNRYHWPSESALSLAFGSITPPRTNFDPDVLSPLNDSTNSAYTRAASSSSLLTYQNKLNQIRAKCACRGKTSASFWEEVYKGTQTADLLPCLFVLLMTVEWNNLLWTHLEFWTLANNRD
jgi:hypothetical protein